MAKLAVETRRAPGPEISLKDASGKTLHVSTLLLDGLICRFKDLSQGQRQITELHVAGDFADLHSFTLKHLDHAVMTLTPAAVLEVPHTQLREVLDRFPHLTRVYWFNTNLDAAIHREWELSLGRRTAIQRTAHLFCELQMRLGIVGLNGFIVIANKIKRGAEQDDPYSDWWMLRIEEKLMQTKDTLQVLREQVDQAEQTASRKSVSQGYGAAPTTLPAIFSGVARHRRPSRAEKG